ELHDEDVCVGARSRGQGRPGSEVRRSVEPTNDGDIANRGNCASVCGYVQRRVLRIRARIEEIAQAVVLAPGRTREKRQLARRIQAGDASRQWKARNEPATCVELRYEQGVGDDTPIEVDATPVGVANKNVDASSRVDEDRAAALIVRRISPSVTET